MEEYDNNLSCLKYSIIKYSSFSANYIPQNILEDDPYNQSSRWSSDCNDYPQFLLLKLEEPSIVKQITFGKYEATHVCNIKKFKIYAGLTEERMSLILESGLENNNIPETFTLKHSVGSQNFAIRFLKIEPLESWGQSFNYSIWYVNLRGIKDWTVIQKCLNWYAVHREKEIIRLCLKHFRRYNYMGAFHALSAQSDVHLEDPLLVELYDSLVCEGNYEACENILTKAANDGHFDQYLNSINYKTKWNPILPVVGKSKERPGMRGGHQMIINSHDSTVYVFGGWDGTQDMSDFWSYSVSYREWKCLSRDTSQEGGPSGRSCHKMCLDPIRREIFTIGRYLEANVRNLDNLKSDFYLYDIDSNKWTIISEDTSLLGGPQLVFDHQMTMDVENRIIYVFGGRVLNMPRYDAVASGLHESDQQDGTLPGNEQTFSGLYSYHVATNTWKIIREDSLNPSANVGIKSRIGHIMLFHPASKKLFILAGQRQKEYLTDFFIYDIDNDRIHFISDGSRQSQHLVPSAGFTQKATIDPETNEIHVLAGLSKDKDKKGEKVRNSFWIYNIILNKWSCIYHNDQLDEAYWKKMANLEPCPRFAHQLVYDDVKKIHYLFGGNPGRSHLPKMRLDDFWSLHLSRPNSEQIFKNCLYTIRKNRYLELTESNPLIALNYLQTELNNAVDHHDQSQVEEFQNLTSTLFEIPSQVSLLLSTPSLSNDVNFPILKATEQMPNKDSMQELRQNTERILSSNVEMSEYSISEGACAKLSGSQVDAWKHHLRAELFEEICKYFPSSMTQPRKNLIDLIE